MSTTLSWKIGDARITRVQEFEAPGMSFIIPDAVPANLLPIPWLAPFLAPDGEAVGSIHALVVEVDDRRVVVDTCIGNDKQRGVPVWNQRQGPFLDDLEAAGFPADSIDTVVCTHLHVDHVGWNTRLVDGEWVPTFPNARYVVARPEWEHWSQFEVTATTGPLNKDLPRILADSVQPIFDAGLVDLVDVDHVISPSVRLEPTPGHTPGHVSVHIGSASEGADAVITGDCFHHPVQFAYPGWFDVADSDSEMATATREKFMASYGDTPTLILGTHFAGPTAGHIVSDGDGWRFVAS